MSDFPTQLLIFAGSLLSGGAVGALIARRGSHQQQARETLLRPAEQFSKTVYVARSRLRMVKPPRATGDGQPPHRNEPLLTERSRRDGRLELCREAIDGVRGARGFLMLVFHPRSPAARSANDVIRRLSDMLEATEDFYYEWDQRPGELHSNDREREELRQSSVALYERHRDAMNDSFERFAVDVWDRLDKPTWKSVGKRDI